MSYVGLGQPWPCEPDEVWSDYLDKCVRLFCEGHQAPYYGKCISVEEQQVLSEVSCGPLEEWFVGTAACFCKPGYRYTASYECVPSATSAGAPAGPAMRPIATASVGDVGSLGTVAVGAAAGWLAYHYLGGA